MATELAVDAIRPALQAAHAFLDEVNGWGNDLTLKFAAVQAELDIDSAPRLSPSTSRQPR